MVLKIFINTITKPLVKRLSGVVKVGGTRGGNFVVAPFFGPKACEDQKKVLRRKISGFSVQMGIETKQSEKRKVFTTNRWSYGFKS